MLKVIVADDEKRICRLICMLADWDALGMEVVATAANGLEALEQIKAYHPDILITDIRMPGCNGLELIERAKVLQPELEVIIISGYAYFDYAQTAIKHGVGEYLLKPIQEQELMASLKKLGERCRQRRSSMEEAQTLKRDYRKQVIRLQEQLIQDLMNKQVENLEREAIGKRYHFYPDHGSMQMFVVKMDYAPKAFSEDSLVIIIEKTRYVLMKLLDPLCSEISIYFGKTEACGIMCFDSKQKGNIRNALREAINHLSAQRPMFGPVTFSIGLGAEVTDTLLLPKSLKTAQYAVMERLNDGTEKLLEADEEKKKVDTASLLQRYQLAVRQAVDGMDTDGARAAAEELAQGIQAVYGISGKALYDLVESAGKIFILYCNNPQLEELTAQYELSCRQCSSKEALFKQLFSLQEKEIKRLRKERDSENTRPIRIAKKYVQEHYREPITLEDVCVATGFSVSYFSVLFKKETGEGFAKYLTSVRIDRAKELLQETDLPIAEICREVGYSDVKHFVQLFRKATGLNPGQYRKLYG